MGLTKRSAYKARDPAARMRECRRAYRLRRHQAEGGILTDIEAAWLARYAAQAARNLRHATAPPPTVEPALILSAAAERFGVAVEALRRNSIRSTLEIDVARAVAVHALVAVGCTHKAIGELLNRVPSAVSSIRKRQRGREATFMRREVEQVLQAVQPIVTLDEPPARPPSSRPTAAGDLVWVTVRLVVGDPLWRDLDRRAELLEASEGAIDHRTARDKLRDAE